MYKCQSAEQRRARGHLGRAYITDRGIDEWVALRDEQVAEHGAHS